MARVVTFDGLGGDYESVAEQVLRQSLTTQRDEILIKFIECPPELNALLQVQAEMKAVSNMMLDVRNVILRHSRKEREKANVRPELR